MTPDELRDFDAACRKSVKAGNEWMDTFLSTKPYGGTAVKRSARRVYEVPRKGADIQRTDVEGSLSELLQLLDIGPVVRKLRKQHETHSPGKDKVPSARWGALIESSQKVLASPAEEALACLRLLHTKVRTRYFKDYEWVTPIVSRRLAQILVSHPVLFHPRLIWDSSHYVFSSDKSAFKTLSDEVAPLGHTLHTTSRYGDGWPCKQLGFTDKELMAFDQHPVVAMAFKARAPHVIQSAPTRIPQVWGKTLGELMYEKPTQNPLYCSTLLRIERNQRLGVKKSTELLANASYFSETMRTVSHNGFTRSFVDATLPGREDLLEGLRHYMANDRKTLVRFVLESAHSIFVDKGTLALKAARGPGANIILGESNPAPDTPVRLDNLLEGLLASHLAATPTEAAQQLVKALFPLSGEGYEYSSAMDKVDVQTALTFLMRMRDMGVDDAEMNRRIHNPEYSCSSWVEAESILARERQMRRVMETHQAAASDAAPASGSRRRMRGSL